jgi:hypothetical protein
MTNIFDKFEPSINRSTQTNQEVPEKQLSKEEYEEETKEIVKLIRENKRLLESFKEEKINGYLPG